MLNNFPKVTHPELAEGQLKSIFVFESCVLIYFAS